MERKEEIIEIKPGLGPFRVNVRALWRRLFAKPEVNPVTTVAQRFIQLFEDYGVHRTQIPRLVPQVTLNALVDSDRLLATLTPKVLREAAVLFAVRVEWLEASSWQRYDRHWTYKRPETFFKDLSALNHKNMFWPIRVFSCRRTIDYRRRRTQPLALVLADKIATWGEKEIYRYTVYGDSWDWSYRKCRIQLKAMIRMAHERYELTVPIYLVNRDILETIQAGRVVPGEYLGEKLSEPFLEDFVLSADESEVSKEGDEIPQVFGYTHAFQLRKLVGLPSDKAGTDMRWRREMFL